jgi:putative phosphoesterase
MKRIGIFSDTHSFMHPEIQNHFNDCDEVWHVGDFGYLENVELTFSRSIFRGVFGNIDDKDIQLKYPEYQTFEVEGVKILMIHIAGSLPRYNTKVKKLIKTYAPRVLVCGHSHILKVQPDPESNLLYINPGAAGNHGFHRIRTLLKMDLTEGKIKNMQVIELGNRGSELI